MPCRAAPVAGTRRCKCVRQKWGSLSPWPSDNHAAPAALVSTQTLCKPPCRRCATVLAVLVSKAGGPAKQSVQAVDNLKAPVPWCGDQAAEPLHLLRQQSNATGSQCSAVTGKCPAAARQATRARPVPVGGGGSGMCMAGKASAGRCCAWQGQAVKQLLQASGRHRTAGGPASTHLMCKKHGLPSALHWTGSAASS